MNLHPFGELKKYASCHGLPTFVGESEAFDPSLDLGQSAYADKVGRQFPVHTKAATWMSHLWYLSDPSSARFPDIVERNLEKAAQDWGIQADVDELRANMEKAGHTDDDGDYALIIDYEGNDVKRFPVNTVDNIKASAAELHDNRSSLPLEWRKVAACVIFDKAAEAGVPVGEYIEKAAGCGTIHGGLLASRIKIRSKQMNIPALREKLAAVSDKILSDFGSDELVSVEVLEKVAGLLDKCDRVSRIYSQYDQGLRTPEELCYEIPGTKVAAAFDDMIALTNGTSISKQALTAQDSGTFDLLGDDFVAAIDNGDGKIDVEKAAELLPTLPRDDANLAVQCVDMDKQADFWSFLRRDRPSTTSLLPFGWGEVGGSQTADQKQLFMTGTNAARPGQGADIGARRLQALQSLAAIQQGKIAPQALPTDQVQALTTPQSATAPNEGAKAGWRSVVSSSGQPKPGYTPPAFAAPAVDASTAGGLGVVNTSQVNK